MPISYETGDTVRLHKRHPCGSYTWKIWRKGADIGIECTICRHRLMMDKATLEKRLKEVVIANSPDS